MSTVEIEYSLAWAILMIVLSIGVFGILYLVLSGPFDHFVGLTHTETPEYAEERAERAMDRHTTIWAYIPAFVVVSVLAWGFVQAVIERGGGV